MFKAIRFRVFELTEIDRLTILRNTSLFGRVKRSHCSAFCVWKVRIQCSVWGSALVTVTNTVV